MCCVRGGADEQRAGAGTTTAGPHGLALTAANVPPRLLGVQPTSDRLPPERATATSKQTRVGMRLGRASAPPLGVVIGPLRRPPTMPRTRRSAPASSQVPEYREGIHFDDSVTSARLVSGSRSLAVEQGGFTRRGTPCVQLKLAARKSSRCACSPV